MNKNILENTKKALADLTQPLISDDKFTKYFEEAIGNLRQDRVDADEHFKKIFDMVINEGDSTSASKEMATNFFKMKTEANDKMIKILDLWTRMKLKEKNTMPDWLKAKSIKNQQINIHDSEVKKQSTKHLIELMDEVEKKDE